MYVDFTNVAVAILRLSSTTILLIKIRANRPNTLGLNVAKTEFSYDYKFAPKSIIESTLTSNHVRINQIKQIKSLGINIDENISLKEHVKAVAENVASIQYRCA